MSKCCFFVGFRYYLIFILQAIIQDAVTLKEPLKKTLKKAKKVKSKPKLLLEISSSEEKWTHIQKDMSKALSFWNDVAKKYDGKPNPDDTRMLEIKKLLKDLQKKLTQFT